MLLRDSIGLNHSSTSTKTRHGQLIIYFTDCGCPNEVHNPLQNLLSTLPYLFSRWASTLSARSIWLVCYCHKVHHTPNRIMREKTSSLQCDAHHGILQRQQVLQYCHAYRVSGVIHVLHKSRCTFVSAHTHKSSSFGSQSVNFEHDHAIAATLAKPMHGVTVRVKQNMHWGRRSSATTENYHFNTFATKLQRSYMAWNLIFPLVPDFWRTMSLQATSWNDIKSFYLTLYANLSQPWEDGPRRR